ncbi:unnamed protein product [Urochloa humidicola]
MMMGRPLDAQGDRSVVGAGEGARRVTTPGRRRRIPRFLLSSLRIHATQTPPYLLLRRGQSARRALPPAAPARRPVAGARPTAPKSLTIDAAGRSAHVPLQFKLPRRGPPPPTRGKPPDIRMDEVTQAVGNLKKEWSQVVSQLEFRLDLLAQQLTTFEEVQSGQAILESWDEQYKRLHASLRNANLQAKGDIRKAAQEERELLLGGGEESTIRRCDLQTKAGMTSAAESITESLRWSRQMMVQEVERSASTLATYDESTSVVRKAEGEYHGHQSLLMCTRGLLSTVQWQDVLDRVILTIGFIIFSLAVLYVVSRRIGLLTLQRKLADAIRSGSLSAEDIVAKAQHGPAAANAPTPTPPIYDEL